MNDTPAAFDVIVDEHYRRMSPLERMSIASSMFDTARAIVESSLPAGLSRQERRLAFARRMYEGELPDAALQAYANWVAPENAVQRATRLENSLSSDDPFTYSDSKDVAR
jgi:hypothetical protein